MDNSDFIFFSISFDKQSFVSSDAGGLVRVSSACDVEQERLCGNIAIEVNPIQALYLKGDMITK